MSATATSSARGCAATAFACSRATDPVPTSTQRSVLPECTVLSDGTVLPDCTVRSDRVWDDIDPPRGRVDHNVSKGRLTPGPLCLSPAATPRCAACRTYRDCARRTWPRRG